MENTNTLKRYSFTSYFFKVFKERAGFDLSEDDKAFILAACSSGERHTKIDDKGRHSEYITLRLHNKLLTVVCDADTAKIITVVPETHHRKAFERL